MSTSKERVHQAQFGSDQVHVCFRKENASLTRGNLCFPSNFALAHIIDLRQPPIDDFCQETSCVPRTAALKFMLPYGPSNCTNFGIYLVRHNVSFIPFQSNRVLGYTLFCPSSGLFCHLFFCILHGLHESPQVIGKQATDKSSHYIFWTEIAPLL